MKNFTITPQQASDQLQAAGFRIGYDKIRSGLQQSVFPFGVAIKGSTGWEYIVYAKDLERFIMEHQ